MSGANGYQSKPCKKPTLSERIAAMLQNGAELSGQQMAERLGRSSVWGELIKMEEAGLVERVTWQPKAKIATWRAARGGKEA